MFYSHEVLTSRKYGVATVWLVATLGSKSATTKKVTRKAILNVDVPKACETILEPEVPLALRLQSNLLFGLSKVYSQQCTYVLADAQTAQNNIRAALVNIVRTAELDTEAGRARPDQLVLEDDPSFLPDFALTPLDLDDGSDLGVPSLTRSSSLSSLRRSRSPRPITLEEHDGGPVLGIQVPSSDNSPGGLTGFVVPGDDGPGTRVQSGNALYMEDEGFEPGVDFGFDVDGNLVEHAPANQPRRTPATIARPRLPSSSAASARVRQEHEDAQQPAGDYDDQMDIDIPLQEDDEVDLLPDAEALPSAHNRSSPPSGRYSTEDEVSESSSVAQAPMRRQPKRRTIPVDQNMELRNADLANWMNNYVDNMLEASKHKQALRAAAQARKNAEYWVLGLGIGGVGAIPGNTGLSSSLDMFRGDALLLSLGIDRSDATKKRGRQDADKEAEASDEERRVRRRSGEDEIGRGDVEMEDGGPVNAEEEEDVELGREPGLDMESRLSQTLPWNITASVRNSSLAPSARRALGFGGSANSAGGQGSIGGIGGSLGRRSRMVSASPLQGRGPPGNLAPLAISEAGDYGNETLGAMGGDISLNSHGNFELYGGAADIDTQPATESQLASTAFAKEMENFGIFVFDKLKEKEEAAGAEGFETGDVARTEILFEDVLPPESTARTVAAQGFMHLLSLTTHGRVAARQIEPFGEIVMSLPRAKEAESPSPQ